MSNIDIFSDYGLIGDNLELKKDIKIKFDEDGNFRAISYNDIGDIFEFLENKSKLLIIPGLINSHVHIGDSFAKEQGFNKPLKEVVAPPKGIKHLLLNQVPRELVAKGIKKAVDEMLSNGITFFIDFREGGLQGLNILSETLKNYSDIKYISLGRYVEEKEIKLIFEAAGGIGLPSYNNISLEAKEKLIDYKKRFGKIIACHVAELKRNPDLISQIFDDNVVDIFIHGTHFNENDLKLIKERGKSLVLCPCCNGYFGVGFPPINKIVDLRIPIAIGTDNIMANNLDLFEELRYLYRILRIFNNNTYITAKDLLKMITINPAKMFNIQSYVGSIDEGKHADFFMIDLNNPNYYTSSLDIESFYALILGRTNASNIKKTYIRGKHVHEKS
ncbi:MAG: amidohydrolase family protein [Candidatus Thorarchaeota archaeon]